MIRVRIGQSWKQNPEYRAGLQAVADGASRGFSPRQIVDCIQIELDGVDITGGIFEVPLLDTLPQLAKVASALDELTTERQLLSASRILTIAKDTGSATVLRLHSDDGDERQLEFEAEIDPDRFAGEVRRAVRKLHEVLVELHPSLANHRVVARLRYAGESAKRSNPEKRSLHPEWSRTARLNDWQIAIRKRGETLHLLDSMNQIRWTGGSARKARQAFETALSDGASADQHIRIERGTDTILFGRCPPFPRSLVVASFQELFPDFEVGDFNRVPKEQSIPVSPLPLPSLAESPGLPQRGLRRVAMRRAWSMESDPGAEVLAIEHDVVIRTPRQVAVRTKRGELRWTADLDSAQLVRTGETSVIVGARHSKVLEIRDATSGDIRRRADVGFVRSPRSAHALSDGTIVVQDETRLIGIGTGQGRLWTHDFRDRYSVVSSGAGLIALSTGGVLEGLNAAGETCWRQETALGLNETLQIDHSAGIAMAAGRDEAGFPLLVTISAADGSKLTEQRLNPGWTISPTLAHGRIFAARQRKNRVALLALDASTGREAFDVTLPVQSGVLLHAENDGHLLVVASGGEWTRLASSGIRVAHHPPRDADPTLSPRQPRLLLRLDKLIVSAGTHLHFADAQTGRPLASLEPGDLTLTSACALTGPVVITAGADGRIEAWESRGHIGVVSNRFSAEDL